MLVLDLGEFRGGPVRLEAAVPHETLNLAEVDFSPTGPVEVTGSVAQTGAGQYYLRATARVPIRAACRRCLRPLDLVVEARVEALFSEDAEQLDDPNVYAVARDARTLDLRPAVRDELILTSPGYPLCREDCRGLCPKCGADLNAAPCDCAADQDPRWEALLKRT